MDIADIIRYKAVRDNPTTEACAAFYETLRDAFPVGSADDIRKGYCLFHLITKNGGTFDDVLDRMHVLPPGGVFTAMTLVGIRGGRVMPTLPLFAPFQKALGVALLAFHAGVSDYEMSTKLYETCRELHEAGVWDTMEYPRVLEDGGIHMCAADISVSRPPPPCPDTVTKMFI